MKQSTNLYTHVAYTIMLDNYASLIVFLAHLWGAYAIPVALSGVQRPAYVVCRLCPP